MKILALIPARMDSSRFPGKPLKKILNKPMIGHVYDRVRHCNILKQTVVATCDQKIADYISSINGQTVMTGYHHQRATERCAEALKILEKKQKIKYDIIVMVQGDEPMVHPDMISEVVQPLLNDTEILVTNLFGRIESNDEFKDYNVVKMVCDLDGNALYFSREPIPNSNYEKNALAGKQYGIIAFQREFLLEYVGMPPTPLEKAESVDMLRIIENGIKIKMILSNNNIYTVDTQADLKMVERLMSMEIN